MSEQELVALSPVDGRYAKTTEPLRNIFSEYGLICYRLQVETAWFSWLASQPRIPELPALSHKDQIWLEQLAAQFNPHKALRIKALEAVTNHDVKAVEYFLKECLAKHEHLRPYVEWVHFCCTSEDINNLAYALMLSRARTEVLLPAMQALINKLDSLANAFADAAMLARTHGQPASPTTMGKELANTSSRLKRQLKQFEAVPLLGKINGAVGNYNAHQITYPELDWPSICQAFVESIGLEFNPYTTQIEPHDFIVEYCQALGRFNTIMVDYNRDSWGYISLGYFRHKPNASETGSSTMPHKVNPIDFENSEGNLGLANALFTAFADSLTTSRWQRDLTDSTLLRNLGVALAHTLIGWQAAMRGTNKLELRADKLKQDLDGAWEVLAEAIQMLMRKHGIDQPYERIKAATRGHSLDQQQWQTLMTELELPDQIKAALKGLRPNDYIGLAAKLAKQSSQ